MLIKHKHCWLVSSCIYMFNNAVHLNTLLAMTGRVGTKRQLNILPFLFIFLAFNFLFSPLSYAQSQDLYAFKNPHKQAEFTTILKDLRCLVCQGQDLNDSQTQFAETLRQEIHQWVIEGKSEKEILDILVDRYGETISYKPPLQKTTYILWIAPFILFISVIIFLLYIIRKRYKY